MRGLAGRPPRRAAALLAAGCLLIAVLAGTAFARSAWAQSLVADLSNHLIAINTGFVGTEVVLFGATDGPGDVAVVVQGPPSEVMVRRKSRIAGIWINAASLEFQQAPSFYSVATNRPLDQIVGDAVLARHEIGLSHLRLPPAAPGRAAPDTVREFREALIRNKQELGLYNTTHGQVAFLGERLFRTNVYFPANVPTGAYTVTAYLIRDGDVVSAQTTPLAVSKVGFSAEIFEFAVRQSTFYGISAIIFAVAAGWLAGAIFRKV
ncbi:hypothetical protein N825_34530 [Skermanella stibiiresistens SB22]|uniref:Transmembrane protein n=1 Tax=Skermanella stibiiresistens SB22 TaxID=1385369 RepID=W9H9C3_9PROT|nr:TIGR02186 family protein [Skermanella stibiiresistens]EWY40423.1 hypothetical protein N825_34530 [Skermanella stibiiresistens SB22]